MSIYSLNVGTKLSDWALYMYVALQIFFANRACRPIYCCTLSTEIINLINSPLRIIIFRKCMNRQFFRKLTQNLIKCNDHSLRFISLIFSILCENVLQNVRNYSGNKSMDARNFLQVGTSLNNFKHKRKKAPLPIKKMAHKRRKNASHMEEKAPVRWVKHPT